MISYLAEACQARDGTSQGSACRSRLRRWRTAQPPVPAAVQEACRAGGSSVVEGGRALVEEAEQASSTCSVHIMHPP